MATVQVTIVGLGQIGTSIGLALAEHKELVRRVGHDRESAISRAAEKKGALDSVSLNLPNAVHNAHIVVLALPLDQIRPTLEVIASELKEDALVIDTGPAKEVVAEWAKELLPDRRYYVGLTPVINPVYLHAVETGIEAAHADLFRKGMIAVVTPPGTPSEAIRLATDFIRLLGSEHLFVDPVEIDSLMAATHILPQLMAAALLNITVDQPGWTEGRRIAGRPYAELTSPIAQFGDISALANAAIVNRANVLRVIDSLSAALRVMRDDIQEGNEEALNERLERARDGRVVWLHQRQVANWTAEATAPGVELPTSSEWMGRLFGLNKPKFDRTNKDKKK
jgi:prephenate dehydrogenase